MRRVWLSLVMMTLIMTSLVVARPAGGQQPAGGETKLNLSAVLPDWLDKLELSPQQKTQIQTIAREHDKQFAAVWGQFGGRYQETLRTEAVVLATIEDHLTDAQRQQAREQRQKILQPVATNATPVAEAEAVLGVALTPEQEALGRKVQEKFQARLSALGRDVHQLHNRLLSIEMNKIVEIEKVLTKEQRELLGKQRQAAVAAAVNSDEPPATKSK